MPTSAKSTAEIQAAERACWGLEKDCHLIIVPDVAIVFLRGSALQPGGVRSSSLTLLAEEPDWAVGQTSSLNATGTSRDFSARPDLGGD